MANVVNTGRDANVVDLGGAAALTLADSPLRAQRATLVYTDTTAKALFTLPAGAILIGWAVNVSTAFDDVGSNRIDLGDGIIADRFLAAFDCGASAAGMTVAASADEAAVSADTVVTGVYTPGTSASAGAATITALYIVPAS